MLKVLWQWHLQGIVSTRADDTAGQVMGKATKRCQERKGNYSTEEDLHNALHLCAAPSKESLAYT